MSVVRTDTVGAAATCGIQEACETVVALEDTARSVMKHVWSARLGVQTLLP